MPHCKAVEEPETPLRPLRFCSSVGLSAVGYITPEAQVRFLAKALRWEIAVLSQPSHLDHFLAAPSVPGLSVARRCDGTANIIGSLDGAEAPRITGAVRQTKYLEPLSGGVAVCGGSLAHAR